MESSFEVREIVGNSRSNVLSACQQASIAVHITANNARDVPGNHKSEASGNAPMTIGQQTPPRYYR